MQVLGTIKSCELYNLNVYSRQLMIEISSNENATAQYSALYAHCG